MLSRQVVQRRLRPAFGGGQGRPVSWRKSRLWMVRILDTLTPRPPPEASNRNVLPTIMQRIGAGFRSVTARGPRSQDPCSPVHLIKQDALATAPHQREPALQRTSSR